MRCCGGTEVSAGAASGWIVAISRRQPVFYDRVLLPLRRPVAWTGFWFCSLWFCFSSLIPGKLGPCCGGVARRRPLYIRDIRADTLLHTVTTQSGAACAGAPCGTLRENAPPRPRGHFRYQPRLSHSPRTCARPPRTRPSAALSALAHHGQGSAPCCCCAARRRLAAARAAARRRAPRTASQRARAMRHDACAAMMSRARATRRRPRAAAAPPPRRV